MKERLVAVSRRRPKATLVALALVRLELTQSIWVPDEVVVL